MLAFLLAAPLFRRDSDGPTALLAALFLILLANPFAAASISLQLSFAAMAGILFLTPRLYRLLMNGRKGNWVTRFLTAGFSACGRGFCPKEAEIAADEQERVRVKVLLEFYDLPETPVNVPTATEKMGILTLRMEQSKEEG